MKQSSYSPTPLPSASPVISPSPLFPERQTRPLTANSTSSSMSPSLAGGYLPKVSFDTFENPAAPMFSFTLQVKSDGYKRNRSTRVFLCASSPDESGTQALDWVMESLVQDGDELIVLRGFDTDELRMFDKIAICCIYLHVLILIVKDHDALRDDARELMRQIQRMNIDYDADRKVGTSYKISNLLLT